MNTYTPKLTALEYFGLETLFRKLVTAYEADYSHSGEDPELILTENGISVRDFRHPYLFGSFAARELLMIDDVCTLIGTTFYSPANPDAANDTMIDVSEYLSCSNLPIDDLMDKIAARKLETEKPNVNG